jgi:hypothetical protein
MKTKLIFAIAIFVTFTMACGTPQGTPIEFSRVCDVANDGKYFQTSGVIAQRGSIFCSSIGGRNECGFDLLESPGSEKKLRIDILQGSGASTVDKVERGYKAEDINIRDSAGNRVALNKDVVKVTGKVSVAPATAGNEGTCFMQIDSIDR